MSEIQIFNNPDFGEVRTLTINGEPWFVGKDVSTVLGYAKPTDAIRKRVDDEDRGISKMETPSGIQEMVIINESGLYSLIFGSKLESAKKFKHWVTSEVLPQIRKSGGYSMPQQKTSRDIPVGEIARLSTVMDRVMVRQNSKPHDIARAFEMLCGQFGIALPDNFVNVPEYEQMSLSMIER